jgi:Alpha/beta hydrolase of unknown function (DUF900)
VTLFVDLRATPSGGVCAAEASLWDDGSTPVQQVDFVERLRGRDLVLAAHGFNVSRKDGVDSLTHWNTLMNLPGNFLFAGVLWPGDSRYFPVVDYPFEGDEALASGRLLASFVNRQAAAAASVSLVSHSLGARVVLEALAGIDRGARRLIMMAGAIENDCLVKEYQNAAGKADEIYALASRSDDVLKYAFPAGNLVGQIIMHGHPYARTALGRDGPAQPLALPQRGGAWQIPDGWGYGHGDYLRSKAPGRPIDPPVQPPGPSDPVPDPSNDNWRPSWSAGAVSTQVE